MGSEMCIRDRKIPVFNVVVFEESLDETLVLCQTGERTEEVAVTQLSLSDVVGIDALVEEVGFLVDLGVVLPLEKGDVFYLGPCWVEVSERGQSGWEGRVFVLFLALFQLLGEGKVLRVEEMQLIFVGDVARKLVAFLYMLLVLDD